MEDQDASSVVEKYAPGTTRPPGIFRYKTFSLKELVEDPDCVLTEEGLEELLGELNRIAILV